MLRATFAKDNPRFGSGNNDDFCVVESDRCLGFDQHSHAVCFASLWLIRFSFLCICHWCHWCPGLRLIVKICTQQACLDMQFSVLLLIIAVLSWIFQSKTIKCGGLR